MSAIAGCSLFRSLEDGDDKTRTNTERHGTKANNINTGNVVNLSIGETFTSKSGISVRVRDVVVQKSWAWTDYYPFVVAADGQLILCRIEFSKETSTDSIPHPLILSNSERHHQNLNYEMGHPTPVPPIVEPTVSLSLDGKSYGSIKQRLSETRGTVAFDVPARTSEQGRIVWDNPERTVIWNIPDSILQNLPRAPSFVRHSVSISGWPGRDGNAVLNVEIENSSDYTGTYRAVIIAKEADAGHDSLLIRRDVGAHTRTEISKEVSFYTLNPSPNDSTTKIIFDDGQNPHTFTLQKQTENSSQN